MLNELIDKVGALLQADRNTAVIALIVAAAAVLLGLLCWIFSAVGLAVMAKRRDVKGRWMGWFPVFNVVLLGRLADGYLDEVKGIPSDKRRSLPALEIATALSGCAAFFLWSAGEYIPVDTMWITIAVLAIAACAFILFVIFLVQFYSACYQVCYSCTPDDAKLLTVLSVLLPVLLPFFVFALRKKANGMPPRRMQSVK